MGESIFCLPFRQNAGMFLKLICIIKNLLIILLYLFITDGFSKSTYPDANYSNTSGAPAYCFRCHLWIVFTNQTHPARMAILSSANSVSGGGLVTITATKSDFDVRWKPGLVLSVERQSALPASQYAERVPLETGWQIVNSSNNNTFNFIRIIDQAETQFTWLLRVPQRPDNYRISIDAMINHGFTNDPIPSTKRAENHIDIVVTPASESVKPKVTSVTSQYQVYIFISFSEQIEESSSVDLKSYRVTNLKNGRNTTLKEARLTRDSKTIILKTAPLLAGADYSIQINSIKDYAAIPNVLADTTIIFKPDLATPYRILAEYSQDVIAYKLRQLDEIEYLGRDSLGLVNRIIFAWHTPEDVRDLLSGINFVNAKLKLRQSTTSFLTLSAQDWDVYRLNPDTVWNQWMGTLANNLDNWSGFNQDSIPLDSRAVSVAEVNQGIPVTWWEWDITNNFKVRYENLGGVPPNRDGFFLRLKARDETQSVVGGIGFYGHDARDLNSVPCIELILAPPEITNNPPLIFSHFPSEDSFQVIIGDTIIFSVGVSDSENDTLYYQWEINGISGAGGSHQYTLITDSTQLGNNSVKVFVSDRKDTVNHNWIVLVGTEPVNFSGFSAPRGITQLLNSPNPFSHPTRINFTIPNFSENLNSVKMKLIIYNLAGKMVRDLFDEMIGPGHHTIEWNGQDDDGQITPAGIYWVQLKSKDFNLNRKILKIN